MEFIGTFDPSQEVVGVIPERTEGLRSFSSAVFADFYQSYRHSQGSSTVQEKLFPLLARYYKEAYSPSEWKTPDQLHDELSKRFRKLTLPHAHKVEDMGSDEDKTRDFSEMWGRYKSHLADISLYNSSADLFSDDDSINLVTEFGEGILTPEIQYQETNRPNRIPSEDPHESILRHYLVEGMDPKSTAFSAIYGKLGTLLIDLNIMNLDNSPRSLARKDEVNISLRIKDKLTEKFGDLVSLWEGNHPGEQFVLFSAGEVVTT